MVPPILLCVYVMRQHHWSSDRLPLREAPVKEYCDTMKGMYQHKHATAGWCVDVGPEVQGLALTAVVVRMDSLFWADSTLMRRRMSSCMVTPWSVVYRVIWVAMVSAAVYMSAMLFRPVLTSGSVHLPAPPGTSAQVLGADAADQTHTLLGCLVCMSQESTERTDGQDVRDEVKLKDTAIEGNCRGKATGSALHAPVPHAQPEKAASGGFMQVNNLGQCVYTLC